MGKRKQTEFTDKEQKYFSKALSLAYQDSKTLDNFSRDALRKYIELEKLKYEIKKFLIEHWRSLDSTKESVPTN